MKRRQINNNAINQIILIVIIVLTCILVFKYLSYYLPGFLGAITLYILFRKIYSHLTERWRWNKPLSSVLLILLSIVFIVLPVWALINYLTPKLLGIFENTEELVSKFNMIKDYMQDKPLLKEIDMSDSALFNLLQKTARYIPNLINSVAEVVINLIVSFFVLYFMQVHSKKMEETIYKAIPFSEKSKIDIWEEVNMMVRSNALGIPILGFFQGIVAVFGYYFFGVDNAVLWGIVTGIATIIPIIGTMAVYVPICLFELASGDTINAIWLILYCFILVGGIDNVLRFTILKTIGDVPPLITVFGVLLGLNLFGMLGLIFGPLIISSVGLLLKVYSNEYGKGTPDIIDPPHINKKE